MLDTNHIKVSGIPHGSVYVYSLSRQAASLHTAPQREQAGRVYITVTSVVVEEGYKWQVLNTRGP